MDRRKDFDATTQELIRELEECSIEELQLIRLDWEEELKQLNVSPKVIEYCNLLTELVIAQKQKKREGDCMTYPLNEEEFVERWVSVCDDPDDGDRELAMAIVKKINKAYAAGMRAGAGKEKGLCRE